MELYVLAHYRSNGAFGFLRDNFCNQRRFWKNYGGDFHVNLVTKIVLVLVLIVVAYFIIVQPLSSKGGIINSFVEWAGEKIDLLKPQPPLKEYGTKTDEEIINENFNALVEELNKCLKDNTCEGTKTKLNSFLSQLPAGYFISLANNKMALYNMEGTSEKEISERTILGLKTICARIFKSSQSQSELDNKINGVDIYIYKGKLLFSTKKSNGVGDGFQILGRISTKSTECNTLFISEGILPPSPKTL